MGAPTGTYYVNQKVRVTSNGGIRVRNEKVLDLFDATPAGTPVVIHA